VPKLAIPAVVAPTKSSNILVCNMELSGFMDDYLDLVSYFARYSAHQIGIPTSEIIILDPELKKWHVNKGPFVHAKTKEVFEQKTFKRLLQAFDSHPETVNNWIAYVNNSLPNGINLQVTRFEYKPLQSLVPPTPPKPAKNASASSKIQQEMETYLEKFGQ
jgi:small subunit ribosomal protein S10